MKKKSVLSLLLLAAALALSLAGCAGQGQPGGKEPVVNSDGTITKEENDVKITETAARSIETELYETADFSLQIPKAGQSPAAVRPCTIPSGCRIPSQPLNQMFVLLKRRACCTARRERTPMRITSPWGTHGRRCFPRRRC